MKNFKKIWLVGFLSIYLLAGSLLFIPTASQADDSIFDVDTNVNFTPQISIPDSEFTATEKVAVGTTGTNKQGETVVISDLLAKYINAFYKWGLSIASVVAVLTLMAAGIMWITSRGDSGAITKAKGMIAGSLTGIALLVGAWFILNTINPNLTKLPAIEMVIINKTIIGCCEYTDKAEMTSDANCKKNNGTFKLSIYDKITGKDSFYMVNSAKTKCSLPGCCVMPLPSSSGFKESKCMNSILDECPKTRGEFVDGSCAIVASNDYYGCKMVDQCDTAKNGDNCFENDDYYSCYNKTCWGGDGKLGEPCGNDEGSACKEAKGCGSRDIGGRDCQGTLACCAIK